MRTQFSGSLQQPGNNRDLGPERPCWRPVQSAEAKVPAVSNGEGAGPQSPNEIPQADAGVGETVAPSPPSPPDGNWGRGSTAETAAPSENGVPSASPADTAVAPPAPPSSASEVGYKKPPKSGQFQKGKSGNPRGRPPKTIRAVSKLQRRKDFFAAADKQVLIEQNGKQIRVSAEAAFFHALIDQALAGRPMAMRLFAKLHEQMLGEQESITDKTYDQLTEYERHLASDKLTPEVRKLLNDLRRKTRLLKD